MEVDDILDQSSSIQQTDDKGRNILDDVYNFKNFDVAKNPLDHHYLGGVGMIIDYLFSFMLNFLDKIFTAKLYILHISALLEICHYLFHSQICKICI